MNSDNNYKSSYVVYELNELNRIFFVQAFFNSIQIFGIEVKILKLLKYSNQVNLKKFRKFI